MAPGSCGATFAIEAAIAANPQRDRRHTICHLSAVDDANLPRFAELGVTAQFSAQWAAPDQYWSKVVLDRNIFEIPPQEIHKTKVAMTVMNGKVRHEGSI